MLTWWPAYACPLTTKTSKNTAPSFQYNNQPTQQGQAPAPEYVIIIDFSEKGKIFLPCKPGEAVVVVYHRATRLQVRRKQKCIIIIIIVITTITYRRARAASVHVQGKHIVIIIVIHTTNNRPVPAMAPPACSADKIPTRSMSDLLLPARSRPCAITTAVRFRPPGAARYSIGQIRGSSASRTDRQQLGRSSR